MRITSLATVSILGFIAVVASFSLAEDRSVTSSTINSPTAQNEEKKVVELDRQKQRSEPFKLEAGKYRVTHHLYAKGTFSARVSLLEEEGNVKRIPLVERSGKSVELTEVTGNTTLVLLGRYQLQYRFRGDEISGEIVFERIENTPSGKGDFGGMYIGELQRIDHFSTRQINPIVARKRRATLVVHEENERVRVAQDDLPIEQASLKGQVLVGVASREASPEGGPGECREDKTIVLQKKQKSRFFMRELITFRCGDGTFVWQEYAGLMVRH
mgnify:FL=1